MENYQHDLLLWLFCSIVFGVAAALGLYYGLRKWRSRRVGLLGSLRGLALGGLLFLLLAPVFLLRSWKEERPSFLVAWDNSQSMGCCVDSAALHSTLAQLRTRLHTWSQSQGINLHWHFLDPKQGEKDGGLGFVAPQSNLSALLERSISTHEGTHVAGMLLLSDGLYNQGTALDQLSLAHKLYTLGVGDTLPRRDLVLEKLLYNKIAYPGTHITIEALISQYGYTGKRIQVTLKDEQGKQRTQTISLSGSSLSTVRFTLPITGVGTHRYQVQVHPLDGELSTANNRKYAFVKVLKDKLRVLILAPYPHPDLGALRQALSMRPYYQVDMLITSTERPLLRNKRYDVALLYDAFAHQNLLDPYRQLQKAATPCWWFFTSRSQRHLLQTQRKSWPLALENSREFVEVTPVPYIERPLFEGHLSFARRSDTYPPVVVPPFRLQGGGGLRPLLEQKIGDINTHRPLWLAGTLHQSYVAFSLGDGFWRWRLQEAAIHAEASFFDELVAHTVQYLSTQVHKRRFQVYPIKPMFSTHEEVVFRTQMYDVGPRSHPQYTVALALKSLETGQVQSYTYVYGAERSLFRIAPLSAGRYHYSATLDEGTQSLSSTGKLYVEESSVEAHRLRADYPLLRRLATRSGGAFFEWHETDALLDVLGALPTVPRRYPEIQKRALIDLSWLLWIITGLLVSEWALRKYLGGI